MESGNAGGGYPARFRALLHWRTIRRWLCARTAWIRAQLGGAARDERRRRHDARAVSEHGAKRLAAGTGKLALSGSALSRLLRLLQSRAADLRNAVGKPGDGSASAGAEDRRAGGDEGG